MASHFPRESLSLFQLRMQFLRDRCQIGPTTIMRIPIQMMHVRELPTVKWHSVWPLATLTSTRPAHQVQSRTNQAMVSGGQTS